MVKVSDKAPDFTLPGIERGGAEIVFTLKDYRGKKVILYFYPKDNTPGCITEACDFRDNIARLSRSSAVVFGISPDSIESHKKFIDKHGLLFTLLSDSSKKVATLYGAFGEKKMYGKTTMGIIRSTFLIDENGLIQQLWRNVKAKGHVEKVLAAMNEQP